MPDIFNAEARKRIAAAVHKTEQTAQVPGNDRRFPGWVGGRAGFGNASPLFMGKVGYGGMTASSEDWGSFGQGSVTLVYPPKNIHQEWQEKIRAWKKKGKQGAAPVAVAEPFGALPLFIDTALDGIVLAINPSCKTIEEGTAVIMGMEWNGNFVVIFEMCPCGEYDGYTGST